MTSKLAKANKCEKYTFMYISNEHISQNLMVWRNCFSFQYLKNCCNIFNWINMNWKYVLVKTSKLKRSRGIFHWCIFNQISNYMKMLFYCNSILGNDIFQIIFKCPAVSWANIFNDQFITNLMRVNLIFHQMWNRFIDGMLKSDVIPVTMQYSIHPTMITQRSSSWSWKIKSHPFHSK